MEQAANAAIDTTSSVFRKAANVALDRKTWLVLAGAGVTGAIAASTGVAVPIDTTGSIFTSQAAAAGASTAAIAEPTPWHVGLDMLADAGANILNGGYVATTEAYDWAIN